jgi:NHLM bacteriocin system ABC transporter ATP-binding protein
VRLEKGWHKNAFGALLGRLATGEAVALLPSNRSGYYYLEPGTGRKRKIRAKEAELFDSEAVFFYKPLPARPLKVRDLVRFILGIFDRKDYLSVVLAAAVVTLIGLLPAWANQVAFGVVAPSGDARLILPIAGLLVGVTVATALLEACRNLVMARISTKLDITTEAATFARVLALPTSFFKEYSSGNLASRVSNVTLLVRQLSSLILGSGLTSILSLAYVFQIAAFAPALAVPALIVALVQAGFTVLVTFATMRYEKATMEANATLSGTVTALLNGIQKVKLAGAEERAFAKWARGYSEYARAAYNRPIVLRALPAIVGVVGVFGVIVIDYFAGTTGVTYDNYMAFNVAFGQVTAAIMALAQMAGQAAQISPMLEMVSPILEATPEVAEDKPSVTSLNGTIEMSDVSFRYSEDSPYVVQHLSFKIRSGEYVAFVGKSGCGKSTIMRLLLGFEKPDRGGIFYGPLDVSKVDLQSLRRNIGTVMQDGRLFMGDIASNITISMPNATIDDAWEAAEIAGIADDIRKMPMGMQTLVTEGSGGVSGGQRQRIMIARAVCGHRKILVFDEATSALDNKTQKHVSDSLEELKCTRIVVAHRLSTVRHCDRIFVVDGGTIAEEGTYDELLAKNGIFAELVARQRLDGD